MKMRMLLCGAGGVSLLCFALLAAAPTARAASQSTTSAWGDVWDFPDSNQQQVDLNKAEQIWSAQHGGLGPVTNYNAPVTNTSNSTYNGAVNSSTSLNVNNMSQSSSSVNADNSMVTVTQSSGQTSGTTDQGAASKSVSVNDGGH